MRRQFFPNKWPEILSWRSTIWEHTYVSITPPGKLIWLFHLRHFYKGDNSCDFLFASHTPIPYWKGANGSKANGSKYSRTSMPRTSLGPLKFVRDMGYLRHWGLKLAKPVTEDARPTGDQEVADSIPAGMGNILLWRLIMKYFLQSFSPFRWFKGSYQFLLKVCVQILVNRLEDCLSSRKHTYIILTPLNPTFI